MTPRTVAVLGAGIMGSTTALLLARRGTAVSLFDAEDQPFSGASRWNEGKIHLGFLYAADRSLQTARRLLPGGLAFRDDVETLLGPCLRDATTREDDLYLIHKNSVAGPDDVAAYFEAVMGLARDHPDAGRYLVDLRRAGVERLGRSELDRLAGSAEIVAGFRTPERSVSTTVVADRFVAALSAEPRIEPHYATRVRGVRPVRSDASGPWLIDTDRGLEGPFDAVVNALWQGRPIVDASLGPLPETTWSHRYRLALFVRTLRPLAMPSAVIAVGPFGDTKNYDGRDFYLSWYPAGLRAEGNQVAPPAVRLPDDAERKRIAASTFAELGRLLPSVRSIADNIDELRVEGGWVFAIGAGSLADPDATLHQRYRVGIDHKGSYISVDTGKYSIAPRLAREIVALLLGE